MKRFWMLVVVLCAMSAEAIVTLDLVGGSPPGCC